ncbi:MAG: xanthine dehydrogenase family protein molybdopterin-binding subunit [Proteobacteria bacterium]|nr:xanthine dehydrogenase family protein molybdopterin-binding subunit [Pseudomonadota bacterium]
MTTLSRRSFIGTSVAMGGALLLQVVLPRSSEGKQATDGTLNAYIKVGADDRVTVVMPKVEMGQGTYTSLPMLVAEELEVPLDRIDVVAAPADPKVYGFDGDQSTGGSTTIRLCFIPLRKAGAAARMMLIGAAAQRWRVAPDTCHAEQGQVVHSASGRHLRYGEIAAAAAAITVPADPPLKNASQFKLIGRSTARRDSAAKTNGAAIFGIDVQMEGMKVAVLSISPVSGSKAVEPLNSDAALAVKGVLQVVNEGDLVAVVATDTWSAMKGMRALAVHWGASRHDTINQKGLVNALEAAVKRPGAVASKVGNASGELKRAAQRVDSVYHQPFLAHATMEPMNCTVHWQKGLCEIWTGTQAPDRAVAKLAELGIEPGTIRINNQLIGGGFGRRLEVDGVVYAVRIARHVEGPVKVLWSREEDIQHDMYRPYYVDRISAGLDGNGHPTSWMHTIAGSAVSAVYSGEPLKNGIDDDAIDTAADPVYALPNLEVRFVQEEPPGVPTSWWRGVGPTRSIFVVESFMDELAAQAKVDPVKFRRPLIKEARMRAVFDLVVEKSGWTQPLPAGHGRGIAIQFAFGSFLAQVVEVEVDSTRHVKVHRVVCALDCGQLVNPDTVHAQLEGGTMFGLSAALYNEITFESGRVQQRNFNDFRTLRMSEAPRVESYLIENHEKPGGVGETGTAGAAAALCNAIYAACGVRVRTLPVARGLRT